MPFKSCAYWPAECCPSIGNYSEDNHETFEQAEAVIHMLRRDGFGGQGKFYPIKTEIKKIEENKN